MMTLAINVQQQPIYLKWTNQDECLLKNAMSNLATLLWEVLGSFISLKVTQIRIEF